MVTRWVRGGFTFDRRSERGVEASKDKRPRQIQTSSSDYYGSIFSGSAFLAKD